MKLRLTLHVIFFLFVLTSCSRTEKKVTPDLSSIETELRAFESAHKDAINAKDINGVLQFYSEDLITVTPDEPVLYGKDWISGVLKELYNEYDFIEDFKLKDIKLIGDKVVAVLEFTQEMTPLSGGETIISSGKGVCILRKNDSGIWQFEWNSYAYDSSQK